MPISLALGRLRQEDCELRGQTEPVSKKITTPPPTKKKQKGAGHGGTHL
jgi:hypothetical protein